jgi:ankyrin repeat protein
MGADVNVQNNFKSTPIHRAIDSFNPNNGGNITVLTYLLSHKNINANTTGLYGNNLLHYACENINNLPLDVFKLLIETIGCDVNTQNIYKDTPLRHALRNFNPNNGGDINVLTYLIDQKNLNVGIKDQKGFNLLHLACNGNLSGPMDSAELNEEENDTILCHIVERCLEQVLDDTTF